MKEKKQKLISQKSKYVIKYPVCMSTNSEGRKTDVVCEGRP